jgi:presequence protease
VNSTSPSNATAIAVGTTIGGYSVLRTAALPHLNGTYIELEHSRTGARHIHIACPDENNAFSVTFPTIPQDSTGVAHILEHTVLTGSQRYPVRDPFFSMIPRSLSTFMNALTYPAFTSYPFSTRNATDFQNLLEVYLDANFFPFLRENSFKQEGWRYEFSELENPDSPLEYKGVVYNEMKGANSSVARVMYKVMAKAMLPDTTFANDSGGQPDVIPNLTWQALRAFHARHYHPSNAYFMTYGNLPLEATLVTIESNVLSKFDRLEVDSSIPNQPRRSAPIRVTQAYAIAAGEPLERKAQVLVSWLTDFIGDGFKVLCWRVLSEVLLANAASPLRKALIESGIGSALADGTGYNDYREIIFSAGLKDVNAEDAEKIENLILGTLEQLVQTGIDPDLIDAAIHQLEIEAREVSDRGEPYGLKVMFRALDAYLYGGDPLGTMRFDLDIQRLESERAKGGFFEGIIRREILGNPHRATVILTPDSELNARLDATEKATLEAVKAKLSPAQIAQIIAEAKSLKAEQDLEQDLSSLPTLQLSDVPMGFEDVPHTLETIHGARVGLFPQPTNGLAYISISSSFAGVPDPLKDLMPIFAFVASKMGGGNSDYLEMAARIERFTGGVSAGAGVRVAPDDLNQYREGFTLSSKALERNIPATFEILRDLLTDLKFNRKHLKNLLGQYRAALEARVVSDGHMFALQLTDAQLSPVGALRERLEGVTKVQTARRLAALDDAGLDGLILDLETIREHLYRATDLRVCVTAEASELEGLKTQISTLLEKLPLGTLGSPNSSSFAPSRHPVARTTAVPVAYDALTVATVPYTHPDSAVLFALARYLRQAYLHPEVREKGGAYGGFAAARAENGLFAQLSYRDPHIVRTFGVYRNAAKFVLENPINAEQLKESILASCSDVDPLLSADSKGTTRFFNDLAGYTLPVLEVFKRRLLAVTSDDLRRVAQQYISPENLDANGAMAVITGAEKIEAANLEMGGIFTVSPV